MSLKEKTLSLVDSSTFKKYEDYLKNFNTLDFDVLKFSKSIPKYKTLPILTMMACKNLEVDTIIDS